MLSPNERGVVEAFISDTVATFVRPPPNRSDRPLGLGRGRGDDHAGADGTPVGRWRLVPTGRSRTNCRPCSAKGRRSSPLPKDEVAMSWRSTAVAETAIADGGHQ